MLENVGAVDGIRRLLQDRKPLDHVPVLDVPGVGREAPLDQKRRQERKAALEPESRARIKVLPVVWRA
jgi:hypothetical protein